MGDEEGALKLLGRFLGANPEGSLIGMPFHQGVEEFVFEGIYSVCKILRSL